jgi:hypothetical protein
VVRGRERLAPGLRAAGGVSVSPCGEREAWRSERETERESRPQLSSVREGEGYIHVISESGPCGATGAASAIGHTVCDGPRPCPSGRDTSREGERRPVPTGSYDVTTKQAGRRESCTRRSGRGRNAVKLHRTIRVSLFIITTRYSVRTVLGLRVPFLKRAVSSVRARHLSSHL